ncbi:hypothetical protein Avbf_19012 [Armadillidium vulgare]|nr:hypothetical protein Avbf_19012 [Armadillidium vulgare]
MFIYVKIIQLITRAVGTDIALQYSVMYRHVLNLLAIISLPSYFACSADAAEENIQIAEYTLHHRLNF